jgi:hypothetical protein
MSLADPFEPAESRLIAWPLPDLARAYGIGITKMRELVKSGEIESVRCVHVATIPQPAHQLLNLCRTRPHNRTSPPPGPEHKLDLFARTASAVASHRTNTNGGNPQCPTVNTDAPQLSARCCYAKRAPGSQPYAHVM